MSTFRERERKKKERGGGERLFLLLLLLQISVVLTYHYGVGACTIYVKCIFGVLELCRDIDYYVAITWITRERLPGRFIYSIMRKGRL